MESVMPRKKTPSVPYSQAVVTPILERLADGESLRTICKDPGMPTDRAVRWWVLQNEDFAAAYYQARNLGLDAVADEVIAIADGEYGTGDVMRDRLRFDARRWYLSKLAPKRYGDTLRHEVAGSIDLRAAIRAGQARAEAQRSLSHGLTVDADAAQPSPRATTTATAAATTTTTAAERAERWRRLTRGA